MRIGVLLPHGSPGFGTDMGAIPECTQAAEALGYHFMGMGEHVLGANPASRPGWIGPLLHRLSPRPFRPLRVTRLTYQDTGVRNGEIDTSAETDGSCGQAGVGAGLVSGWLPRTGRR